MQSTELSPVRAAFRDALRQLRQYPVDETWPPAFLSPVTTLALPERPPYPAKTTAAPVHKPFAGQSLTLAQAARHIADGSLTAVQVAQSAIDAINRRENELNAFVYALPAEQMLAQAEALDRERAQGHLRGTLHGITIAVKDLIAVAGMPNTASSPVLSDRVATQDATSIHLLKQAGAVITGKTQTHEFALGVTTPQSRNPWDATRDPGGSSGGSAIAVATGMSLGAMATDTRASVRVPSALCGITGFKPTFGLVPADGVIMLSWSLDHVCPMAATVEDIAVMLNVLIPRRTADYTHALNRDVKGLRIGVPVAALVDADDQVASVFQNSVAALRSAGATVVDLDTPTADDFDLAVLMGLVVSRCEAASYHRAFQGREHLYATTAVAEQLDEASRVPAVAYLQAQRCRADLRNRMLAQIRDVDALLMPTCRVAAPKSTEVDKYFLVLSQNCILWSFIGFPVVTVPCGLTNQGLPVGAQLAAGPLEESRLLGLAYALEEALGTKNR